MPGYVPRFMSIGESFVYSDDGNIKRFTSGARPNSILTDKDCNRFKLLPHYRCRRQLVERDPEVRILSWMGLVSLAAQVNRIRNETELFDCSVMIISWVEQFDSQWKFSIRFPNDTCSLSKLGKGIKACCIIKNPRSDFSLEGRITRSWII